MPTHTARRSCRLDQPLPQRHRIRPSSIVSRVGVLRIWPVRERIEGRDLPRPDADLAIQRVKITGPPSLERTLTETSLPRRNPPTLRRHANRSRPRAGPYP
jgi:hypothetical protein